MSEFSKYPPWEIDLDQFRRDSEDLERRIRKDKGLAKRLLVEAGIYTEDGELRPEFRSSEEKK